MHNPSDRVFEAIEQLQILSHLFIKRRAQLAKSVGLTEAQWRVLEEINQSDFMPSMFAAKHEYSKAAVSKVLKQLSEMQLIESNDGTNDARFKSYTPTPKALESLEKLRILRAKAIEKVWEPIEPSLLKSSIAFNDQLIRNLRNM